MGKFPFKICFGYFPPSSFNVVYGHQGGVTNNSIGDALKERKKMLKRLGKSIASTRDIEEVVGKIHGPTWLAQNWENIQGGRQSLHTSEQRKVVGS